MSLLTSFNDHAEMFILFYVSKRVHTPFSFRFSIAVGQSPKMENALGMDFYVVSQLVFFLVNTQFVSVFSREREFVCECGIICNKYSH